MGGAMTVVVTDLEGLQPMRSKLSTMLTAHGVDAPLRTDVQVATTELVTNGLTHASAPAVAVRATIDGDRIRLHVHHADRLRRYRPAGVSVASDPGGRGLDIVGKISDDVAVERTAGHRTTALTFERRHPQPDGRQEPLLQPIAGR